MNKRNKIVLFTVIILLIGIVLTCIFIPKQGETKKTISIKKEVEKNFGQEVKIPKSERAEITSVKYIKSTANKNKKDIEITYGIKQDEKKKTKEDKNIIFGDYTNKKIGTLVISHGLKKWNQVEVIKIADKNVYYGIQQKTKDKTVLFYSYNEKNISYTFSVEINEYFDKQDVSLLMEQIVSDMDNNKKADRLK